MIWFLPIWPICHSAVDFFSITIIYTRGMTVCIIVHSLAYNLTSWLTGINYRSRGLQREWGATLQVWHVLIVILKVTVLTKIKIFQLLQALIFSKIKNCTPQLFTNPDLPFIIAAATLKRRIHLCRIQIPHFRPSSSSITNYRC